MFSVVLAVLPGVGFLMQLRLLWKPATPLALLIHPSQASCHGSPLVAAADSSALTESLLAAAAVPCGPSSPAFVVGSLVVHQHPIVGSLAEVVHQHPAAPVGAAAGLEEATEAEDCLAAFPLASPVAGDPT